MASVGCESTTNHRGMAAFQQLRYLAERIHNQAAVFGTSGMQSESERFQSISKKGQFFHFAWENKKSRLASRRFHSREKERKFWGMQGKKGDPFAVAPVSLPPSGRRSRQIMQPPQIHSDFDRLTSPTSK